MAKRTRKHYTREFKVAAVADGERRGMSVVAKQHGLAPAMLYKWRSALMTDTTPAAPDKSNGNGAKPQDVRRDEIRRDAERIRTKFEDMKRQRDMLLELVYTLVKRGG